MRILVFIIIVAPFCVSCAPRENVSVFSQSFKDRGDLYENGFVTMKVKSRIDTTDYMEHKNVLIKSIADTALYYFFEGDKIESVRIHIWPKKFRVDSLKGYLLKSGFDTARVINPAATFAILDPVNRRHFDAFVHKRYVAFDHYFYPPKTQNVSPPPVDSVF
ncbi:hypothetical protein [Foetidibacter luteolus]|uniref:hypothetical protein n=1 Tax=Foetidibacter luteolus TaxID=2608880 RepID=UPI00129C094E|nr:hypothetical protein [Foetidibacter luteolus]